MLQGQEALYEQVEINRSAIVVRAKQPLFDWLHSLNPDDELINSKDIGETIYLVEDLLSEEEIEAWLKDNYYKIFFKELSGWHLIISDYPRKLSFEMFKGWFDYKSYPMVIDVEEDVITKLN